MIESIEQFIDKLNNIEKQGNWVERHFYLGGKNWYVSTSHLGIEYRNGYGEASKEECREFVRLYNEMEGCR